MADYCLVDKNLVKVTACVTQVEFDRYGTLPLPVHLVIVVAPIEIPVGNCKPSIDSEGVVTLVDGSADKVGPQWDALRTERNLRLSSCDWIDLPNYRS